jgi:hypothetical protein
VTGPHIQLKADHYGHYCFSEEKNANYNFVKIPLKYLEIQLLSIDFKMTTTYNVQVLVTAILFNYPKVKQ